MSNKIVLFFMCLLSFGAFCCNEAKIESPTFCADFRQATACHCTNVLHVPRFCQDINSIYSRMLFLHHDVKTACERQQFTKLAVQDCIDHWTCYYQGGTDSQNRPCSGNKHACV